MRWIVGLVSAAIALHASRAAATSCEEDAPVWQEGRASPLDAEDYPGAPEHLAVPLDATPWELAYCDSGEPAEPTCVIADGGDGIPLMTEDIGREFCARDFTDAVGDTSQSYLRRYIPPEPLTPGRTYTIECRRFNPQPGTFRVRDSDEPAAPPVAIEVTRSYFSRGDTEGCCGGRGDVLELDFSDMSPAYLAEGGYIEAVYPSGQHLAFIRPDGEHYVIPWVHGVIELTPVSASGVRGETLALDAREVDGDLVYIPCAVTGRRPTMALWLLAPLVWIGVHGRRRRRSA